MRRFLLQSFLYSSFLLLTYSCKTYQLKEAQPISNSEKEVENLYFSSNEDYVYKCQMEVYGNDISGILIVKKISETSHRVVMTSDFGNKMIDFEISEDNFKLNYVLEDLNKKMVINFLKNDFRELLRQKYPVIHVFEDDLSIIYDSKIDKKNYYLSFNKENSLLTQIVYTRNNKEKINFSFEAKKPTFAETIHLEHKDFRIDIKLFQITETE
jgi:hypothetical protein